jgi:hypothetical protein
MEGFFHFACFSRFKIASKNGFANPDYSKGQLPATKAKHENRQFSKS